MEFCNRCGKCMTDGNHCTITGVLVRCVADDINNTEFMQKQFGKYDIGTKHKFCYECFLDSLYGKS